MLNTRKPVEEVKAILEAMNYFSLVSTQGGKELVAETVFPSIYINYDYDMNENNGQMRQDGGEYNRIMLLTLSIHLDLQNEDELLYLDVRDMVETALLKDSRIWQEVVDRDVLGSKWDTGLNYPKRQGEVVVKLFTRACA